MSQKEKSDIEWSKSMDKYAQIDIFHHDQNHQVYMYAFMYIDTNTISEEDYFQATR